MLTCCQANMAKKIATHTKLSVILKYPPCVDISSHSYDCSFCVWTFSVEYNIPALNWSLQFTIYVINFFICSMNSLTVLYFILKKSLWNFYSWELIHDHRDWSQQLACVQVDYRKCYKFLYIYQLGAPSVTLDDHP